MHNYIPTEEKLSWCRTQSISAIYSELVHDNVHVNNFNLQKLQFINSLNCYVSFCLIINVAAHLNQLPPHTPSSPRSSYPSPTYTYHTYHNPTQSP